VIKKKLANSVKQHCLLLGVGNVLRADDAFGPMVIKQLEGRTSLPLLDGGSAPENSLGAVCRLNASEIIIIDALCLKAPVGSLHWIEPDELENFSISTHAPSLDLLVSFIHQHNAETQVHIIGVVPEKLDFGMGPSEKIRQAAEELAAIISSLCPSSG